MNGKNRRPTDRADKPPAQARSKRRHPVLRHTFRAVLLAVGSACGFGAAFGVGYVASMLRGLPKVSAATFTNNSAASVVYDDEGRVIGQFAGDGDRQPIASLNQVSPYLVQAFVAAEDKTFFTNIGVNPMAMGRAFLQDLLGHRIESGASTITQQTVKLAVFPEQERTLKRKIQEIALALEVSHVLSKDEILTDYMNWVYMGRMGTDTVYGVKRASEILFGKEPNRLTLAQAALLAALPNNPSYFSPYQFPQHALMRQHYILDQMLANHMISKAEYDAAYRENVLKTLKPPPMSGLPAHPYLLLDEIKPLVIQDLVRAGIYDNAQEAESALPVAGLKIYTTIDLTMQEDVERVLSNPQLFAGTDKTYRLPNGKTATDLYEAGFAIVDNHTGAVLAVGGGRDYLRDAIDHADLPRQPGSSIKPLLDYGPAIDTGLITAASEMYDAPTRFPGAAGQPPYEPHDDEPGFAGLMTARVALYESRNVPAIDVLSVLTPQVGFSYLSKMGLGPGATTWLGQPTVVADDENHLAAAIGGLDNGVTVLQMTSAYSTFANQGVWHQSYLIRQITDESGRVLYQVDPATHQVFTPQTAYILTNMLHDVVYHPGGTATAVGARFPGQFISGKTGTTDSLGDGWFIGYTQDYTAGIWMGYNNHEPIDPANYNLKFTLWSDIMAPILAAHPARKPWPVPPGIVFRTVSSTSGLLPTPLSRAFGGTETDPFVQGTEPTSYDDVAVEAKYTVVGGKKVLATTRTPAADVEVGTFIKLPTSRIVDWAHKIPNGVTADTPYLLPSALDPRGGTPLDAGTAPDMLSASQLQPPTGLYGYYDGAEVWLGWNSVPGATQYAIYRTTGVDKPYQKIGTSTSTSFVDPSPPQGASVVYYEVIAESNLSLSSPSRAIAVPLLPPGEIGGNQSANHASANDPGATGGSNAPDVWANGLP
ncbi:glycosyl transferase family 51 [Alicyclobacillus acidocaldarius subsp. acidocaldarius DSM 446]|uniref:Glycosyl transferase family 51 n=1 Tax=Alicyclobacillus acidocaldarius subsp. acidocaldarius (strain ATCC 27009 / DSM 446 / BCRC 14685 / JCM 5260 / KCTC 1825 / NBRC 15652 / NCIMB 11725 / NRRL B-14509 / 104-IA) TaxID=521098 RepID=C8WQI8_ALIAD|nr:glycosyl transferase family 51 [Alicyclobacillus acidocaldarius subsp. acidocaldarius DSM 446]